MPTPDEIPVMLTWSLFNTAIEDANFAKAVFSFRAGLAEPVLLDWPPRLTGNVVIPRLRKVGAWIAAEIQA